MLNSLNLTGKRILVVGAENEIGNAIVRQLSHYNANVSAVAGSMGKLNSLPIDNDLLRNLYLEFDVSEIDSIDSFTNELKIKSVSFNGFVFCSGHGGVRPLSMTKPSFVREMMNENVYSFIEFVRCLSKKKLIEPNGSVVAISSVSSIRGMKSKTAYCSSKAALDASIKCMALELCERKIRVNSIQKGWVSTDMERDFVKNNMNIDETCDIKKQVLGIIEPDEIADTVAFLLCDMSKHITGTSILLDGGYTL